VTSDKRIIGILALLGVLLSVSGCRTGESIGGSTWLDYNGDYPKQVLACVKALPSTIQTPSNEYPEAAEFTDVTVQRNERDDVRATYEIEGSLRLSLSGTSQLRYTWECQVSQRMTILKVTNLSHTLLE